MTSKARATEKRNKKRARQLIRTGIVPTSDACRYHALRRTNVNERPYKKQRNKVVVVVVVVVVFTFLLFSVGHRRKNNNYNFSVQ